ncbi:MAG: 4-hydroxy-3-methylbut-2-enyl diphosphate reductase [Planctomycetota bacterium]
MKILRAEAMGFCFGVRDALAATRSITDPGEVTIHGELVHNPTVAEELRRRGFASTEEDRRAVPETPAVLVTAHGISQRERRRLEAAGKRIVDTTCPLVTRAHDAAVALAAEGRLVLVVGKPGHVEVEGLTGDLSAFAVLRGPEDARDFGAGRLGLVAQTTTPPALFADTAARVRELNPDADLAIVDTVCQPTRRRKEALAALTREADLVIVVGGPNSNNTARLAQTCREAGVPAHHVGGPADLDPGWFVGIGTVGLTAGTSTPDEVIEAVHRELERLATLPRRGVLTP